MTTSSYLSALKPVANVSEIPVAQRGKDINELLYDLLTAPSPHEKEGAEERVAKIITDFVRSAKPKQKYDFDTMGNLHIKVGKNPKTMFSSHMDTVHSRNFGDTLTLRISEDKFVTASINETVQNYVNKDNVVVTEAQMKAEARAAGANYAHYTLLADDLGHTETKRRLYGSSSQFDGWMNTHLRYTVETAVEPVSCILGADDKLGIYTMCKMIALGVEGFYVFHVGEEHGCLGSKFLADTHPETFRGYDHCVAFDRMNYGDIITHQSGGRCCSDEFADALAKQMNVSLPPMQQMKGNPNGSFTDSNSYIELIPECTNVSVGYSRQHSSNENFDLIWLEQHFIPALLKVKWSELPVVREAAPSQTRFQGYGGQTSYSHNYGRRTGSYSSPRSVVPARESTIQREERKRQSNLDKASNVLSNIESYDPIAGFYPDETSVQRRDRVLYTFTKDEMTLQDIAEMVVDADYYGDQRGQYDFMSPSKSKQLWKDEDYWNF